VRYGSFLSFALLTPALGPIAGFASGCTGESIDEAIRGQADGGPTIDAHAIDGPIVDSTSIDGANRDDVAIRIDAASDRSAGDAAGDGRSADASGGNSSDRNADDTGSGSDRTFDTPGTIDAPSGMDATSADAGGTRDGAAIDGAVPPGGPTPQVPAAPLPTVETDSFSPSGSTTDIADDSAIYANPTSPELSVVIADNKDDVTGGVGVFDMQGKLLQFRQDGKIGNIDLRAGFSFGGQSIVLVGGNNRTTNVLDFWQFDPTTRQLSAPIGDANPTIAPNYGFCLYHSAQSGKFYAFVTQETGASTMEQYELGESAGKVTATKVRSFDLGSITEGCVADDEMGRLYVAQEDVALWRYGAEPSAGSDRVQVGAVGDGHLVMDLEGVSLAKGSGNSGYLVLSLQGENRFVTYDRETNAYIKEFTVGSNGSIDAVSQTDGLDICTSNLGPGFPKGALVVHDGSNTGGTTSNLKYVPLQ
jgi:3-phytase